ncbi:hypothetical protein [Rhizobacter sp. Root1221]|uniref:DUF7673 family protein n=1 Tax=Rhizobacter sp. Root1221 TaxID=1736433 RepID=UPI0006F85D70|nr:hypothetical protein [Rhizobacter sp. Root1221]KQW02797.1 hypothetical protein ASC87_00090 [Rhizobacter sp. Root1221]
MNDLSRLEKAGVEALQRLYGEAASGEMDSGGVCARLLLGLYNGDRFPFDLTDLRMLPVGLFEDAMALIRMDARLTRQEVHNYFANGGRKFEDLAADYRVADIARLKSGSDCWPLPRPRATRGTLCHEDRVQAKLVTCGDAPGYRDVTLTLDCELVGDYREPVGPVRLEINLGADDSVSVMQHVRRAHAFAWRHGNRAPLDAGAGERRPSWLDALPTES